MSNLTRNMETEMYLLRALDNLRSAAWVQCDDGDLKIASQIYDLREKVARIQGKVRARNLIAMAGRD